MTNCINYLFILINFLIDTELTDILSYKILYYGFILLAKILLKNLAII